ncbi:MAG: Hsp20/alpha crystallin family protein [Pseudomonadota bacterium]
MATTTEIRVPASMRADPLHGFRSEMERMMQGFFGAPHWTGTASGDRSVVLPAIDVKEDDGAFVLTAEIPGMDEKDVRLEVRNGMLLLSGEKVHDYTDRKDAVHVMERRYGSVQRAWRLPEVVDADAISARFDKGVLTVTMPKRADVPPASRTIQIT